MDQPLRFCMITSFYPPYNYGGDGVYVHDLSNALARLGHQVHVIHCIDAYRAFASEDPTESYDDHPNVTVHALKSPFGLLSPLLTHQTGLPLLKGAKIQQVLRLGFDVIHYHTVSLIGGPGILAYGEGIKLYTAHDHWLVCPTRELFKFDRAVCTRKNCFLCSLTHRRPPQLWRYGGLLDAGVSHVDVFIAGNRFSAEKHRQLGLSGRIVHLPPFVSAQDQSPDTDGPVIEPPQKPYFLFVGRLMKIKGLQTLIPVFRRYGKASLLVAGTGRYERQLRHLAEGCRNIRFLGHIPRKHLLRLYRDAVALIVPSIAYELGPLVVLEAFQQQTPAICRNLGGIPEYVDESGGGFTYDTDEQLIAAMDRLIENPSLRSELGQRGYRAYLRQWTTEVHINRYLGLIRETAATRGHHLPTDGGDLA